ncbi:MAG: TonB-dependent receptor, partial [Betaproteobacteria bacterium]
VERGPVRVTYFNQRFRDLIEYSPTPVGPDSVNYFNVGGAIASGIETSATRNVGDRVMVSLNYTYLHTRVEKSGSPTNPNGLFVPGRPLVRRPAQTVAPQVVVTLGARARVIVGGRWVGKRDDVAAQRVTLPPYTRVNLSGEYTVGSVVLSGSLENACNDQAQEISGFRPLGRTVLLGVRVALD